ncbi:PSP1 domain-containing protein [Algoriphagus limi]|uniref:Signal peptidase-like protein n=1 Tax=Algoriphagus limi TaxID=2975273 RepID=A0ABT2GBN1_9BACT|nr:regulatory iron-sulfur-containing complex subunit RicT [Algoriphagus limi]MCS5491811.1 Signal peptidase-like protein [Algoriphagus limi]
MNSFDWLSHMGIPEVDNFDIVEVKFKGGRKEYFRNLDYLDLHTGDPVVVDVPSGHHIGYVSLQGELVRLQMQKRKIRDDDNITRIYRIANQKDLEKWEEAKNREIPSLYRCRQIIQELGLKMKLSDVEYQADNSKATFYYSADERVDFRELIKILAGEFRIRVEMRQISLRQEAGRLGGIGVCGRELCCSTWLVDFKNVSTSAARYQNLSLNPSKLSGQCGRLKCCLNYELDTYIEAIKNIPTVEKPLLTEQGPAKLQKTDIFRRLMWFSYNNDNDWHSISCDRVVEILEINSNGGKVFNLQVNESTELEDMAAQSTLELELLDKKFSKKKKKKKKNRNRPPRNQEAQAPNTNQQSSPAKQGNQNTPREEARATNNQSQKRRNPRRKPRQRPDMGSNENKNPNQGSPSNSGDSNNSRQKRRFPPRKNQKPNNGKGDE